MLLTRVDRSSMLLSFSVLANSSTVSVSFSISRPLIGPLNVSAVWAETPLTLFGVVAVLSKFERFDAIVGKT